MAHSRTDRMLSKMISNIQKRKMAASLLRVGFTISETSKLSTVMALQFREGGNSGLEKTRFLEKSC